MTIRRLSAEERAAILDGRRQGKLCKQLAFEFSVSVSTIERVCREAKVWRPYSGHKDSVKSRRWYAANRDRMKLRRLLKGSANGQATEDGFGARDERGVALRAPEA